MKKQAGCTLLYALIILITAVQGCKKQSDTLVLPQPADYYPLQAGKVFTYRLDSTALNASATVLSQKSYLVKDSFGIAFNDNLGRPSYPVYRFITDTLNATPWSVLFTYYITPTSKDIQVVDDNNLRYIKLVSPVTEGYTWSGNSYIDTKSATSPYIYMDNWVYTYQNVNKPFTTLKGSLDSTVTVLQIDDTSPPGAFDPANYQQRTYSTEVYARNIGLVYKEFLHWTWQNGTQQYESDSYGIKLNLIDVK